MQLGLLPEGEAVPGIPGARLMTPRDLLRRFGRHAGPPRLLTPEDLVSRFGGRRGGRR